MIGGNEIPNFMPVHGTDRKFHFLPSDKEYPPPSLVNMQGVPPMDALLQGNCT